MNKIENIETKAVYELRQVSELLGVSPSTVLRWTRQGLLPCRIRKINKRKVWRGVDIIEAISRIY